MQIISVTKTHKNIFSDELFTLTDEPIGETPITDNQWFRNGYNVGDILVFSNKYRRYPVEILGYKMVYINRELTASDIILSSYPSDDSIKKTGFSRGSSVEIWEMRTTKKYLRFKAQDYIKDLYNPTQNELLQINLKFPDVNIKELIKGISNLLEIKSADELGVTEKAIEHAKQSQAKGGRHSGYFAFWDAADAFSLKHWVFDHLRAIHEVNNQ